MAVHGSEDGHAGDRQRRHREEDLLRTTAPSCRRPRTDPKEYLGCFLSSHGYLPVEQIEEALARQKSEKKLLGQILVNMGAIAEEDLHQMLRLKTEESIYDIFTWDAGDFEFFDDQLPEETMIRMALDVQGLVLEGTRRLDEWNRIREWVPSPQCVPVSIVDLQDPRSRGAGPAASWSGSTTTGRWRRSVGAPRPASSTSPTSSPRRFRRARSRRYVRAPSRSRSKYRSKLTAPGSSSPSAADAAWQRRPASMQAATAAVPQARWLRSATRWR